MADVKVQAPPGVTMIGSGEHRYDVTNGCAFVPEALATELLLHGFKRVIEAPKSTNVAKLTRKG